MRNIRSQGSFTNLTNAKHLTDLEKRKKGEFLIKKRFLVRQRALADV